MTIIEQIKTELERRIALYSSLSENTVNPNRIDEDRQILSFLSTLEPEKPLGLEEEIERKYANDTTTLRTRSQYAELARYFYDLGCRRTAEKYDEIEYNRQRAEESEKPMELEGLEEELDKWRHIHFNGERDDHFSGEYLERTSQLDLARHFAQWGAEHARKQMLKDAVEYEVWDFSSSLEAYPHVNIPLDNKQYRSGDKVRVIVLPKED